jgi:hypothetical protein
MSVLLLFLGYFENEVAKEPGVRIHEPEIFPEAPAPRDLIDLEVCISRLMQRVFVCRHV